MCRILHFNSSSYYSWKRRGMSIRDKTDLVLKKEIKSAFVASKGTYGSPRIRKELSTKGFRVSKTRVARLMKEEKMQSKIKKKYRVTTNSSHRYPVVPNRLNREFNPSRPNQSWVSDLTYIWTNEGWLYLTIILDLWDRKVVGWSLSKTMYTKDTTIPAWKMAVTNRTIHQPIIFHSDRGVQYASKEFTNHLNSNKHVIRSMSRKGNCWDNAVAESFFKSLKTELVYHQNYRTRREAELNIFEYIEIWYNRKRRHSALKGLNIMEFTELFNYKKAA
jgi:putative transposase